MLHLSRFWLPGCGIISLFRTVPWLIWSPRVGQNTPSWELFSKKKTCSTIKLFFRFKYVLHYTASKYLKKKSGVTVLVQEKRRIFSVIKISLREISYVLHVHAFICTCWWCKMCAVRIRNAILRNYQKKFTVLTRKPQSHVRILIYRTWPIECPRNLHIN